MTYDLSPVEPECVWSSESTAVLVRLGLTDHVVLLRLVVDEAKLCLYLEGDNSTSQTYS